MSKVLSPQPGGATELSARARTDLDASERTDSRPGCIVIVGATSIIGRAIALEFARAGHPLALIGRDGKELSAIAADGSIRYGIEARPYELDIRALDRHSEVIDTCFVEANDTVDGIIVCVGYQPDEERARTDGEEARRVVEANFSGVAAFLERCAERLIRHRSGFLCTISSVAGDRGRQSNYVYGSAKAGLSAYLQGLRNRLFDHGVTVTTIKAGFIDTRLTYGRPGVFLAAPPESIARAVRRAAIRGAGIVYVPWFWRVIMGVILMIPEPLFKRLKL